MRILLSMLLLLLSPLASWSGEPAEVRVDSVVLRLIVEADAPARDAGVVAEILVREGQTVRRGDPLARLDDAEQQLAERAARVDLAIAEEKAANDVSVRYAKKALEAAEAELRRSEESIAKFPKSVSQSQLDVERLTVQRTRLEQEQAEQDQRLAGLERKLREAELDAKKLATARRRITAPIDGVVVEVTTRLGEWLEPGQKALRLVNADRLKAEGFVPAGAASPDLVGREVRIVLTGDGSESEFSGRLVFVSPEIDPINNEVRVWAEVANRSGLLRPGQRPEMVILPAAAPEQQAARQ